MVRVTVLYQPPTDTAAFDEHNASAHLHLAAKANARLACDGASALTTEVA